jgi:oligogalacturonide lyase
MLRSKFFTERTVRTDPTTGIRVIQLTNYPTPSVHFPYDWPSITPDNRYILLYSQRWTQRIAPWDIFRVDADGLNLFQLTEDGDQADDTGYGRQHAIMSHDGKTLYVLWANVLKAVDIETGRSEPIASLEKYLSDEDVFTQICLNGKGDRLFIPTMDSDVALRLDLTSGSIDEIDFGGRVIRCFQESGRVEVLQGNTEWEVNTRADGTRGHRVVDPGGLTLSSMTEDGTDAEFIVKAEIFAHHTIHGRSDRLQGTGKPPHRCIWVAEAGKEPTKLVEGPYFWHSAASFDGEWIVTDTNWPNTGLQYIHVPTGQFRTLCHPHATSGFLDTGHPHPCISRDGRIVVFRSDCTGIPQVYAAYATDEFRESVIAGELDMPRDK